MTTAGPPALGSSPARGRFARGARAAGLSTPFLAVVATLLAWPSLFPVPGTGLDPSWQVGLQMATHQGLDWGTQIIFTYGPLGFLATPLTMYGGLTALSILYVTAVFTGLAAAFVWAARRSRLHVAVAFALALVAVYCATTDMVAPIALLVCAGAVGRTPPARAAGILCYGGGVVCGIEVLVKVNSGLAVAAIVLACVLALPGRRLANLGRFAAAGVATFAVLWFATGQGVGNLLDYLTTSFDIGTGYSAAMMHEISPGWTIWAALALIAATAAACLAATRGLPTRARIATLFASAVLIFFGWKEGFVRHDAGHMSLFFSWMLAPWIAVVIARGGRWRWIGLAGFVVTAALYFGADGYRPGDRLNLADNASIAITQIHDLLDPAKRGADRDGARYVDAISYKLDPQTLKLIGDRPVDVYPWDASLAWTLNLNWDPEPVFQSYTGYTPALDDRNADALSSPEGPRLILRHLLSPDARSESAVIGIDGRYAPYDTPAATLAMICNFRPLRTTGRYQLLGRTPDRCGAPRRIRSVDADYGRIVAVPRPPRRDDVVFARVSGLDPSGVERAASFLYKPAIRHVVFNGQSWFRIVPATAGDGLILRAPAGIDYPAPFRLAPDARTLAFAKKDSSASPSGSLRIDFYTMPVRPYRR